MARKFRTGDDQARMLAAVASLQELLPFPKPAAAKPRRSRDFASWLAAHIGREQPGDDLARKRLPRPARVKA